MLLDRLSFRARLTLAWTVSFGLLLGFADAGIYLATRAWAYRDVDVQARTLAETELASASDVGGDLHIHDVPPTWQPGIGLAGKLSQMYDASGRVLHQSDGLGTARLVAPDVVAAAVGGARPVVSVRVQGAPLRVAVISSTHAGDRFALAVGVHVGWLDTQLRRLAWLLAGIWIAGLVATAAIGYRLASRALAPVERITRRAAAIARGDFDARLDPPHGNDEIARMTGLLNEMLARLHSALEANRRFAAEASHELRSPLTAMAGEVDVTLMRPRSAEEYRAALGVVREGLAEMTQLAESLILLVRAQEQHVEVDVHEVPLLPVLDAAARKVAHLAVPRRITLGLHAFPELVAYGDPRLLARVFDNLLANAVIYNRDGGRVSITGRTEDAAGDEWQPGFAVVEVADTGIGIDPGEVERVFERFYRADRSRSRRTGGAGLGLSICREVATLSGGSVRVSRTSPEGTVFEVRLPGARRGTRVHDGPVVPLILTAAPR